MQPKAIVLSYYDTLKILYNYLKIPPSSYEQGVNDILIALLKSYLTDCTYNSLNNENNLISLLEYYGLHDFETSQIGHDVSNSIIAITSNYLPGFKSYDKTLCFNENMIKFVKGYSVLLYINVEQYNTITLDKSNFISIFEF